MKKKIYYLANTKPSKFKGGIAYKIYKQMELLTSNGFDSHFIYIHENKNKLEKILSLLPLYSSNKVLNKLNTITDNSDIYIRYFFSDFKLIHTLKKYKRNNPQSKIAVEIPTYPYDGEKMLLKTRPAYWKDKFWRRKLHTYVDRIITYSDDNIILKTPTINISNGIDTKVVKLRVPKENSQVINLIAVAKFGLWHGYDRMIEGIHNYYRDTGQKRDIKFYIVGYGDKKVELQYKELIKKYHLDDHVFLVGKKFGKDLDYYYNICDIGIDSLGRHRSNVYYNSSLKGKEYLAKGLPIVSGVKTELDKIPEFKYYFRVPADDTPIDIEKLILFYNSIYKKKSKFIVASTIRKFCENHFDMDQCFEKVIKWFKGE